MKARDGLQACPTCGSAIVVAGDVIEAVGFTEERLRTALKRAWSLGYDKGSIPEVRGDPSDDRLDALVAEAFARPVEAAFERVRAMSNVPDP